MHDSKENNWRDNFDGDPDAGAASEKDAVESASGDEASDGWQKYRRWISKAPVPRRRRSGLDPSLYTWKGYRNWTEQVKRNWSDS